MCSVSHLGNIFEKTFRFPWKQRFSSVALKDVGKSRRALASAVRLRAKRSGGNKIKNHTNVLKHPSCCNKCSVQAGNVAPVSRLRSSVGLSCLLFFFWTGTLKITKCKKGDNGFLPLSCICSMLLFLKIKPEERSETCLSITSCQPSQPVSIFGCCQSVRLRAHYVHSVHAGYVNGIFWSDFPIFFPTQQCGICWCCSSFRSIHRIGNSTVTSFSDNLFERPAKHSRVSFSIFHHRTLSRPLFFPPVALTAARLSAYRTPTAWLVRGRVCYPA